MAQNDSCQDIYPKGLEDTLTIIDLDIPDIHMTLNNSLTEIYFTLVKTGSCLPFPKVLVRRLLTRTLKSKSTGFISAV